MLLGDSPALSLGLLKGSRTARIAIAAWVVLFVTLEFLLGAVGMPWWGLPRFAIAAAGLVLLPGMLVVELVGVSPSPLERAVLAVSIGLVAGAVVQAVSVAVGAPWAVEVYAVGASAAALWRMRGRRESARAVLERLGGVHVALAALIGGTFAAQMAVPLMWRNLMPDTGGLSFAEVPDAWLHLGTVHQLARAVPPPSPVAAKAPFAYHWGSDLWPLLLGHLTGLQTSDLVLRLLPALLTALLTLSAFCLARRWLGSAWGAVLVAALVMFGEDFSYIPGVLSGGAQYWSIQYFQLPSTFSLYQLNPMLPALALLSCGLLCIDYWDAERGRWLWLSSPLLAALAEVKIFTFVQLVLALGLAMLLRGVVRRDWRLLAPVTATVALALPLLLLALTARGPRAIVGTHLTVYVRTALLQVVGAHPTGVVGHANRMLTGDFDLLGLVVVLALVLPLFLVGLLGPRVLGLVAAVRALMVPARSNSLRTIVAVFVLAGIPMSLLISITLSSPSPYAQYDNGAWFAVASKALMWLFAVEVLLLRVRPWRVRAAVLAGSVLLAASAPSAIQALVEQSKQPIDRLDAPAVRILAATARACARGGAVLASDSLTAPAVAVAGCRVPYLGPLGDTTAPPVSVSANLVAENSFWARWRKDPSAVDVLRPLGVRYLLLDSREAGPTPQLWYLRRRADAGPFSLYAVK